MSDVRLNSKSSTTISKNGSKWTEEEENPTLSKRPLWGAWGTRVDFGVDRTLFLSSYSSLSLDLGSHPSRVVAVCRLDTLGVACCNVAWLGFEWLGVVLLECRVIFKG